MWLSRFLLVTTFCCLLARPAAWAGNICGESVPSNRIIDGIPAYAQCEASNGAIYSNDGVATAASSGGTDWVRTQMSGGYQCTELAHRYLHFRWNVKGVPNGNAGKWCDGDLPSGLVKSSTPVHGDLIVFAPGSCGADATTGHVAVVDVVNANNTVTFIEQNRPNQRTCAIDTAACFLHAVANQGGDGGVPDGAVSDAAPDQVPDARRPRDLAVDRHPDSAVPGTGGSSAFGGSGGAGGSSSGSHGSGGDTGTAGNTSAGGDTSAATSARASGGTQATSSTSSAGADAAVPMANDEDPAGCSCSLAGVQENGALPALVLGLLLWRRSRRR